MPLSPWLAVDAATIPAKRARELRDAWEDFVDGRPEADDSASASLRSPIVDSWQRSRDAGVDPFGRLSAPSVLELEPARDRWAQHPLADASELIAHCMATDALDADHLVVISDADGMLLRIRGDAALRSRAADEMNFVEGALWSEAGAGTNAVGTALAAEHAVQVFAAEHFTEPVQRWTCAASPVVDPDTGRVLGVIDLTGDLTGVNPHSLSVVIATARAVEELLRGRMHERDDRLRSRYGALLRGDATGAALITASGRVLLDPRAQWPASAVADIPIGGGTLVLPSGAAGIAEPLEDDDVYVVRPQRSSVRVARPTLTLQILGTEAAQVALDGGLLRLRRRHVELLTLLSLHRGRISVDALCLDLYGDEGHAASIRVEMSRLRRLLPGVIAASDYQLVCDVVSDLRRVRGLLGRSEVGAAAAAYTGPLLPDSTAPGIVRARLELDAWLRQAVVTSEDVEALWSWVSLPSGEDDLVAWLRLLSVVDYSDARRSLAVARIAALRRSPPDVAPL